MTSTAAIETKLDREATAKATILVGRYLDRIWQIRVDARPVPGMPIMREEDARRLLQAAVLQYTDKYPRLATLVQEEKRHIEEAAFRRIKRVGREMGYTNCGGAISFLDNYTGIRGWVALAQKRSQVRDAAVNGCRDYNTKLFILAGCRW